MQKRKAVLTILFFPLAFLVFFKPQYIMDTHSDLYQDQKDRDIDNALHDRKPGNTIASSWSSGIKHARGGAWELNQIIEKIDVGIVVLDIQKSTLEYCNSKFFQLIQQVDIVYDYEQIYAIFFSHDDSETKNNLADLPYGDVKRNDSTFGTVKLNDRIFGYSIYHIVERCYAIFIRDITEIKRLEAIAQTVNSLDNLGFIFSGIRHEVGNPINSLKMTLSVLKQNLSRFPAATVEEYVDRGLADISRVEYLLKSLRNFSMFDTAHLIDTPFYSYITTFQALAQMDLRNRGIELVIEIPVGAPQVQLDPRAMNQVLLNIVSNAADALESCPAPEIRFTAQLRKNILWLTIKDNGCGISSEQKKRLFQPFNSKKPEGNGLGLVISQKLLALMGCSIDIESKIGEGTSVRVGIPVSEEEK